MTKHIVIVKIADEEFGIEINRVQEIIRYQEITKIPEAPDYIMGIINMRGKVVVVMDLPRKLGLPNKENDIETRIVLVNVHDSMVGMLVDSAKEVYMLSNDQISEAPSIIKDKLDGSLIDCVGNINDRLVTVLNIDYIIDSDTMKSIRSISEDHNEQKLSGSDAEPIPSDESPESGGVDVPKDSKASEEPVASDEIQESGDVDVPKDSKASEEPVASDESQESGDVDVPKDSKASEEHDASNTHPTLSDVDEEFHFKTHKGKPLKNVHELLDYIKSLDEETFKIFVDEEKNDFYNWIKFVIKDDDLADRIEHLRSKDDVTKEIMKKILEVLN